MGTLGPDRSVVAFSMSRQIDFSEYTIVDQENGNLIVEHDDGTQFSLSKDGSMTTTALSHTPAKGVSASKSSLLSDGYPIAKSSGGKMASVSWSDYGTDDAALQDLADWIAAQTTKSGVLTTPTEKPDGSAVTIENTVVVGDSSDRETNIDVHITSNTRLTSPIGTTITDGSPLFKIQGDTTTNKAGRNRRFHADGAFNLGGNNAAVVELEMQAEFEVYIRYAGSYGRTGVILDGCANGTIYGHFHPWDSTATAFESRDDQNFNKTSDITIAPGTVVRTDHASVIDDTSSQFTRLYVGGYFEDCAGNAMFDVQNSGTRLFLTPYANLGNTADGTHGVYWNGYAGVLQPSRVVNIGGSTTGGDGIVTSGNLASGDNLWIGEDIHFASIGGDSINIAGTDSDAQIRVPYESAVAGSVSYPAPSWGNMMYHDGWKLRAEGTGTSVAASGSTQLTGYAGLAGAEVDWEYAIASDPNAAVEVELRQGWNDTNGQQSVTAYELSGTGGATIDWRVYYR